MFAAGSGLVADFPEKSVGSLRQLLRIVKLLCAHSSDGF